MERNYFIDICTRYFLYFIAFTCLYSLLTFHAIVYASEVDCDPNTHTYPTNTPDGNMIEPSGLTIDSNIKRLWTIGDRAHSDGKQLVIEMDYCGNRSVNPGHSFRVETEQLGQKDTEGIHLENDLLYIAVEDHNTNLDENNILVYNLLGVKIANTNKLDIREDASSENAGIEAITGNKNGSLYIAKEKNPATVYHLDRDNWSILNEWIIELDDISGMFYIGSDEILLLSEAQDVYVHWNPEENQITKKCEIPPNIKMEGIAVDITNNLIFMIEDERGMLYKFDLNRNDCENLH